MSNVRLAKLRKQPDSTWALLQKRLISIPEPFETLFPAPVWNLIHSKSNALSTNAGYVSTSLITTTAFLAGTGSILRIGPQEMPLNIYSIFVGPPTTGKSQAIKECAITPTAAVAKENDASGCVIQKCTSSGLIKTVAEQEKGFLLFAEIYDILYKLLKSDEENATGAAAIRGLEEAGVGKVCSVQIPRVTNPVIVFVKEDPDKVQWPKDICCQTDCRARFHQAVNKSITIGIKRALLASNCVPDGMFADIE